MQPKEAHWLIAIILVPLITVWVYLVGIYFQMGYLHFFHIDPTFAEILPTFLIFGWVPIVGYGMGLFIALFLIFELMSRWLFSNPQVRSATLFVLTYLGLFLILIWFPYQHSIIGTNYAIFGCVVLILIITSHCFQYARLGHLFRDDSLAFYLSKNFGLLIVILIIMGTSLPFASHAGLKQATSQHSYQVFGQNPEYAVVFIGSKYLFAMPVDEKNLTLQDTLRIISLDALKEPLVYKEIGKLTIVPTPASSHL